MQHSLHTRHGIVPTKSKRRHQLFGSPESFRGTRHRKIERDQTGWKNLPDWPDPIQIDDAIHFPVRLGCLRFRFAGHCHPIAPWRRQNAQAHQFGQLAKDAESTAFVVTALRTRAGGSRPEPPRHRQAAPTKCVRQLYRGTVLSFPGGHARFSFQSRNFFG